MMKRIAIFPFFASLLLAAAPERPKILGIAHIALFTKNIDQSRAFYHDFLGFDEPFSLENSHDSLSMAIFKINDRQYIEISPERAPGTDRLSHIAIQTDDAEAMREYLASKGIKVPNHVPKGRIGSLNFTIKDPDEHVLEIVQYSPDSWSIGNKGTYVSGTRISRRMMHVGILVGSLAPAMRFYCDLLGFRETWRGSKDGKTLSWVNVRVPDGDDYIEFMLYKNLPTPTARGSAHHMCLEVSNASKSIVELNAKPYRAKYQRSIEEHVGVNRKRQVNLFDPDGTRIELMETVTVDGKPAASSTVAPPSAGQTE
jgi:lactoylglutathione lyase